MREIVSWELRYTVLTAPSGGRGLELASTYSIDVVIVDYVMPEMDGREVATEIRRLKPQQQSSRFQQREMFPSKP